MFRSNLLIAIFFSLVFFLCQPVAAQEDTAQISLKKTAISSQKTHNYVVQKGDVISAIIRRIPGITKDDIPDNYRIIKELNPNIEDLNKLYAGQVIVLPGKSFTAGSDTQDQAASADSVPYKIIKGDSLIKIIHQELKIKNINVLKTIKLIQNLNPSIVDPNKIYAGAVIKLPGQTLFVKAPDKMKIDSAEEVKIKEDDEKISESREQTIMSAEDRLAVIKQVVSQLNGSLTAAGVYYLPIPGSGQITIDCSLIPVIEFDNTTTAFLDLENRANDTLRKVIRENWKNYYLVKVDKKDDVITVLRKLFEATKIFTMAKNEKQITIGSQPVVELMVDWIISRKDAHNKTQRVQGLRIVPESNLLFPKAITNYARKSGFAITEISMESGLTGKPEEIYSLPEITVLPKKTAKDFTFSLLTTFGLSAAKNVDVKVFDTEKHGFNLSINADITVNKDDKRYIIFSRTINQQFINVLRDAGNQIIFISEDDAPKTTMENILRTFNYIYTSGYFSFSGLDVNQASFHLSFSGTKIRNDHNLYVVDFAIDEDLRGMLHELWSANFARY